MPAKLPVSPAKEPFPLLNVDAPDNTTPSSASQHGAVRRSGWTSEGNGALATSLAHLSGVDMAAGNNKKHDLSRDKRLSKRRKARSLVRRVKQFTTRHTWILPLAIALVVLSGYAAYPSESNPLSHFIFLSYRLPLAADADPDASPQYGKGLWDIAFVVFYTVVLTFTREFFMQEVFRPLARFAGLRSRSKQARFMEQMYTALYFGVLGPAGLYVMSKTPVWFYNTRGMYENFPHKTHLAIVKFYYLFEAAYWAQQAVVLMLGMEKPRKDFRELVGHHIVSLSLIALSYRFHFTYIGIAVYTTHDISDFFLATSKSLNYVDGPLMGPYYFTFMCAWVYLRHYLNLRIIYSLFTEFKTVGPYELNWETEQYKCTISFVITLALLAALQALNLFWLYFIVRIAYRFVVHNVAKDERSDGEEDTEFEDSPKDGEASVAEKQALLDSKADAATTAAASPLAANGNTKVNGAAAKK
ncbi:ceramide synthase membrane component [Grosmannia clavigera kw1407]|uniref:Ceramide synthase membrane component n=1 Tax=Grosmannia clavigera (strain kw1407 / UAMH 11150) TaxID=655863 RepID=F0XPW6_GROCL|nr:ceramide synthase membrane component [Grosmannia clavigera kw1407]EFX00313.1 ceramide synthase membrane component [Grosmannia clavigera kw1407]